MHCLGPVTTRLGVFGYPKGCQKSRETTYAKLIPGRLLSDFGRTEQSQASKD